MKHVELTALGAQVTVWSGLPPLTKADKLQSLADMFAARSDDIFLSPRYVEWSPQWLLNLRSTNGTVLAPMAKHLNDIGVPTKATLGGIMSSLELNRAELHSISCYCHHDCHTGEEMAKTLDHKAKYARKPFLAA